MFTSGHLRSHPQKLCHERIPIAKRCRSHIAEHFVFKCVFGRAIKNQGNFRSRYASLRMHLFPSFCAQRPLQTNSHLLLIRNGLRIRSCKTCSRLVDEAIRIAVRCGLGPHQGVPRCSRADWVPQAFCQDASRSWRRQAREREASDDGRGTRDEGRGTRGDERRTTSGERRATSDERRGTRDEGRGTRDER